MNSNDLNYIFSNIKERKINVYDRIPTLNTMKQYVSLTKEKGFNFDEGVGKANQKTLTLKRVDGTIIGEIRDRKYPNNTQESVDIVTDKIATENILKLANIETTNSTVYNENSYEQALKEFYDKDDKVAVIKPLNMSQGHGVNVGVTKDDFKYYWDDSIIKVKGSGRKNVNIIVQDYIEGFEARAVVIEGHLISIVARVPAYVVGDGQKTIEQLVLNKNKLRKKCAHLNKRPIIIDSKKRKFVERIGLSMHDIPEKGSYVLLSSISNISEGGEMIDITEYVSEEVKMIALKSIAAIPGMYSGGVDIMMKDFKDSSPRIIELNAWPMLQSTIFPTYGQSYNPQEYFLNAFYSLDQFFNQPKMIYNIPNSEEYIRNYLYFQNLKVDIQSDQIIKHFSFK